MASMQDWLMITGLLSSLSKGRAQGEATNEALGLSGANAANDAQLNRDKFALAAPGERMRQNAKADLTAGFTPLKMGTAPSPYGPGGPSSVINWSGGFSDPSQASKDLASTISAQNLIDQKSGADRKPIIQAPTPGGSSVTDKLLGGATAASTGMSLLKILGLFAPGGKGGGADPGGVFGGLGHFDGEGNWISETPNMGDPSKPFNGMFPGVPDDPNHD